MKTPMNVFNTAMKKKNKNRKGFSLVELIVCLVIMAILAAALVPTLIGYINQTRQSNAKNEAASCVSAAQTIISSAYANPDGKYINNTDAGKDITITDFSADYSFTADDIKVVEKLAEVAIGTDKGITAITTKDGVVTNLKYTAENGEKIVFDGSTYAVDNS